MIPILRDFQARSMRSLVFSAISKCLTHSSNSISSIRFCEMYIVPLCPNRLKALLYRELHGSGFHETYYANGKFYRINHSSDNFKVSKTGMFRAFQIQALPTEKPSYKEMTEEPLPEPRSFDLYRAICFSSDRQGNAVAMLEGWFNKGRKAAKWQLNRIIKDLMKHSRDKHALEVSEWTRSSKKFPFTPGDHAIHLELIAKVHGIASAEGYFSGLPDIAKNQLTYYALLNCHVKHRLVKKAEVIMEKLKELGFATNALPYNQMMSLYMENGQFDKVPLVIEEMKRDGVILDTCSYKTWMMTHAAMSEVDKIENVLSEMKYDDKVNTDWTVYKVLANIYIKAGHIDNAQSALKEMENKTTQTDRSSYHCLISLYAKIGNKEEVDRIWRTFQLVFRKRTIEDYVCLLSSLVKIGDIKGAEEIFEEWESLTSRYDIRVPNVLFGAYIRKGWLEKAELLLKRILDSGWKPVSHTWEIFAEGYIENNQIDQAVEAMRKAMSIVRLTPWKPKQANVLHILEHFKNKGDFECADEFLKILRGGNFLSTEIYNSLSSTYIQVGKAGPEDPSI